MTSSKVVRQSDDLVVIVRPVTILSVMEEEVVKKVDVAVPEDALLEEVVQNETEASASVVTVLGYSLTVP
jgi:hypothetical protein